ncbi:MAG: DUF4443 domain-containing protein [Candidatus Caldarchaeum sp.]|uniref:DUF4443 domain-containing protein n=1 Tax=Caldiarchaeum subterraneum TaxID=311458 RepID=A0A7C5Q947_CALS0
METLRQLFLDRELKGPSPAFTTVQLLYAVFLLGSHTVLGRKRLTDYLGIGEGSVRTMLTRLTEKGLAVSTQKGLSLTDKGRELYDYLKKFLTAVKAVSFNMPWQAQHNHGLVVKGLADRVSTGVEERDEAIRNGASAAMVLTYMFDGLYMPRVANLTVEQPHFARQVVEFFKPSVNDVVIIAGADDDVKARYAALAAAVKLVVGKA